MVKQKKMTYHYISDTFKLSLSTIYAIIKELSLNQSNLDVFSTKTGLKLENSSIIRESIAEFVKKEESSFI
jgi:hypothetical protein